MRNDYRRDWDRATADGRKMWNGIVKFTRDRIEPALPCGVAFDQAELSKTVEQVSADLLAEVGADRIVRPKQGLRRPGMQTTVDYDVLRRAHLRLGSREHAGSDNGEPTPQPHAGPSY